MTAEPTAVRASACRPERDREQLGDAERDRGRGDAGQRSLPPRRSVMRPSYRRNGPERLTEK